MIPMAIIEFIAAPDSFFAERIDPLVTVYRSQETAEIVGSLLKGVSKFLRNLLDREPGFRIEIREGRIRLTHLFTANFGRSRLIPTHCRVTYQKLAKVAKISKARGRCWQSDSRF